MSKIEALRIAAEMADRKPAEQHEERSDSYAQPATVNQLKREGSRGADAAGETGGRELPPEGGMNLHAAINVLDRFGILPKDVPLIVMALEVVLKASDDAAMAHTGPEQI